MTNRRTVLAGLLLCGSVVLLARGQDTSEPAFRVFDGKPKTIVVNGYSTSFQWPKILQRKLDRYSAGKRVLEVRSATKGGTPISKWINPQSGEPLSPWIDRLRPALKKENGQPIIVLAQQSLQWTFGDRNAGIRNKEDTERIRQGEQVIGRFANLMLKDGANEVFIAMHIYKNPMEPEIGNERLALAAYIKSGPEHVHAGPDVWEPTRKIWPGAFAGDKVHPNDIGAEVMAQKWFETLLAHDGLAPPPWSQKEMEDSIRRVNESEPSGVEGKSRAALSIAPRVLRKYDKDGDGKLNKEEQAEFDKAKRLRRGVGGR
jgi:hypothetical protein